MEKHVIQEELKNCPGIAYYPDSNRLELVGRSIPENPELIFKRLEEWIVQHFESHNGLDVHIQLEYINSGSSKYLHEILKRLMGYIRSGKLVKLKWFYEKDDEAMLELGEHFRDTAGIPMEIDMIL
jgi:SiaC family regulatory phosphoprotein